MFGIEMDTTTLLALISGVLAIVGLLFGGKYKKGLDVAVAGLDLAVHTVVSLMDKTVTKEEYDAWQHKKEILLDALADFKTKPTVAKKLMLEALLTDTNAMKK